MQYTKTEAKDTALTKLNKLVECVDFVHGINGQEPADEDKGHWGEFRYAVDVIRRNYAQGNYMSAQSLYNCFMMAHNNSLICAAYQLRAGEPFPNPMAIFGWGLDI